ncbi:TfuA-like protein [Roseovarius sp. D22-M7]|uniref:TfuA-like protein n=1 Tax=Roseovarius sp. D22-M7 TaxID=3127116 RepID=UPI00300FCD89
MKPVVFAGPTIGAADVRQALDAEVLPPVAQGDVYRVARQGPPAIGIIDGYFDGVPSVWHKEILWAIEQGIPVFGSASMGALRAAELGAFGMIGCGRIFEAYRDGAIADDDEVAVLHGPAEVGFVALSDPMVSVRATVERARKAGILTDDAARRVNSVAKSLHYRDRTWDEIIARIRDEPEMSDFLAWLPAGKVDAKRDDARTMLLHMASFLSSGADKPPGQRVERTLVWQSLVRRIDAENAVETFSQNGVLDELRLDPDRYQSVRDRAVLRSLALEDAERRGVQTGPDTLRAMMDRHCRRQGLSRRKAVLRWLDENDLDTQSYEAFLHDAALVEETVATRSARLAPHFLAELRWSGTYSELKDRANDKARVIDGKGCATASPESPDRLRMLIWFFESRLGLPVPDDLEAYAVLIGLATRDELFDLVAREFMYASGIDEPLAARNPD